MAGERGFLLGSPGPVPQRNLLRNLAEQAEVPMAEYERLGVTLLYVLGKLGIEDQITVIVDDDEVLLSLPFSIQTNNDC